MQARKLAGSHAMGRGKVSVWDFSTRKLNKPIPSQNKAFHTERQGSGAAAKAAARSRAVPAVVNWNVLETVPPPPPIKLPWRRWYRALIWIPDCFLNTVWSVCVGGNEPVCWDAGHTGALARSVLPVSSRAGQACSDKMAGWLRALSTNSGEGSSKPPLCLQSGEQGSSRNQPAEAVFSLTQLRLAGKGHSRRCLGSPFMPASTLLGCLPGPACGQPVLQPWARSPGNSPSFVRPRSCWLSGTSCGASATHRPRQRAEWGLAYKEEQEMAALWPLSKCIVMLSSEATPPNICEEKWKLFLIGKGSFQTVHCELVWKNPEGKHRRY